MFPTCQYSEVRPWAWGTSPAAPPGRWRSQGPCCPSPPCRQLALWQREGSQCRVQSGVTCYRENVKLQLMQIFLYCTVLYCTVLYCTVLYCTLVDLYSGTWRLHCTASSGPSGRFLEGRKDHWKYLTIARDRVVGANSAQNFNTKRRQHFFIHQRKWQEWRLMNQYLARNIQRRKLNWWSSEKAEHIRSHFLVHASSHRSSWIMLLPW